MDGRVGGWKGGRVEGLIDDPTPLADYALRGRQAGLPTCRPAHKRGVDMSGRRDCEGPFPLSLSATHPS
jgi:hypothetical protein